jgi:hypothetical protein
MRKALSDWTLLAAAILLAGFAAPQPKIQSNYDSSVDFSRYRTYNIMPSAGRNEEGYETLVGQSLRAAVEREMDSRGYIKDEHPDLLVNFSVTVKEVQKVSTVPTAGPPPPYYYRGGIYGTWPAYSYDTWVREYHQGTLLIDIVDAQRKQLVWEAAGTGRLKKPLTEDIDARASKAVALLFARYPFRAGSGSG